MSENPSSEKQSDMNIGQILEFIKKGNLLSPEDPSRPFITFSREGAIVMRMRSNATPETIQDLLEGYLRHAFMKTPAELTHREIYVISLGLLQKPIKQEFNPVILAVAEANTILHLIQERFIDKNISKEAKAEILKGLNHIICTLGMTISKNSLLLTIRVALGTKKSAFADPDIFIKILTDLLQLYRTTSQLSQKDLEETIRPTTPRYGASTVIDDSWKADLSSILEKMYNPSTFISSSCNIMGGKRRTIRKVIPKKK